MLRAALAASIWFATASMVLAEDPPANPRPPVAAAGEARAWTTAEIEDIRTKATAGNVASMYALGLAYADGDGVEQDYRQAMQWYLKAANLGDRDAMNNIGALYSSGHGVAINYREALKWYRKSAALGNRTAMNNIGFAYDVGHGVAIDDVEAVRWYRKSAEAGNPDAAFNLGLMYENGEGVPHDRKAAARWYDLAIRTGEGAIREKARIALDRVTTPMVNPAYS